MPLHHTPLRMAVWGFRNVFLTTDRWHRYYTRFRLKKYHTRQDKLPCMCEYLVVTTSLVACYKASFQKVQVTSMMRSRELMRSPNETVQVATFYCLAEKYGAQCTRQGVIAPT